MLEITLRQKIFKISFSRIDKSNFLCRDSRTLLGLFQTLRACFKHENSWNLVGAKIRSKIGSVKQIWRIYAIFLLPAGVYRFLWFPIQNKKYRFFRFLAGFYKFFCFPIQSNMRLKASCCFTKIKFPNASQSSLDQSKLTLTKFQNLLISRKFLKGSCVFQSTTKIAESLVF